MLSEVQMAMIAIILERVLEGHNELLVNVLTLTFLSVNHYFKGIEGVAILSQWFERMKSVFHVSNCAAENQVKFATCTMHTVALTWWNTYVKTVGHDAAYGMPWKTLMKMMTDNYCPQNEIKKLEMEI
uniref:Reverse transcriptase domain-containing protein n=1 Tax=Tanacetum cinerariifolium TaxID=118510 RepID=A0A699J2R6_TANCI|nr:reverse transcriptase domain-containing protein [Tanacetum cinerariifolium]